MKTSHTALLFSILLLASFSFPTQGLILNGLRIEAVRVNGLLYCSLNGNLMGNSPPLSGAIVQLSLAGSQTNLGQALTNPAGAYVVFVRILDTLLFDPSSCFIKVDLPLATCSVFPPDGALTASIKLVNIIQSTILNIANYTTSDFVHTVL